MNDKIPVLVLTYNRLEYTKNTLSALFATKHPISVHVFDNGSSDGTQEYLLSICDQMESLVLNKENLGINKPFNEFIKVNQKSEFLAKVDNDTIVATDWLDRLLYAMNERPSIDVLGSFMQRPVSMVDGKPWTFQRWVDRNMRKDYLPDGSYVAYNGYTGGSGVIMRTKLFHEYGLLWDQYPCALGDFTTFQRIHEKYKKNSIAWYSGTTVRLQNILKDGEMLDPSTAEYDEKLKTVREEGNAWYTSVGGVDGIEKLIKESGGRERL